MPIPQPHDGESEQDFVSRCMGDDAMQEYEQKQRAAICYSTFSDAKKAAMDSQTRLYGIIEKVEPQDDGTVKVHGVVSTEAEDDQGEVVLGSAMREAIPDYMQFPALREMHQLAAAGTALSCECGDDNVTRIVGHVVDPVAVKKVRNNVYRGFSIGGRVLERESGKYNTITKLKLNEISLVDRPANPGAVFQMWKASQELTMDGLNNLGEALKAAMEKATQVWTCGDPSHSHGKKEEAVRCMLKAGGALVAEPEATGKTDVKPDKDPKDSANRDGDDDGDDQSGGGLGGEGDGNQGVGEAHSDREEDPKNKPGEAVGKKGDPEKPYGDVTYADPGYRGKKRYPIDNEKHVRAAWSYINMPKNAKKYTSEQLSSIKSKIRAAMKRVGAEVGDGKQSAVDAAIWLEDALRKAFVEFIEADDAALEKAGRSAAHRFMMGVAHDAIGKMAGGEFCKRSGNATQDTGRNAEVAAEQVPVPSDTFRPGENSTQDTSKRGARLSGATLGHLRKAHDSLCKAGAECAGADMTKAIMENGAMDDVLGQTPEIAKALKKSLKREARLEKTVAGMHDEMAAMRAIVEQIAKQPAPAQAAGALPPGVSAVSKSEDGGGPPAAPAPTQEEINKRIATMSPEELWRYQYRGVLDRPYVPR